MLKGLAVLLLHPASFYRLIRRDASYTYDAACICAAALYHIISSKHTAEWLESLITCSPRWIHTCLIGGAACIFLLRYTLGSKPIGSAPTASAKQHILPPLLIPCRTTHTRLFPKKHSFSYSYLYVGIPVGWRGRSGTLLSADVNLLPELDRRYGWFHVSADDLLESSTANRGLEAKLSDYLENQGIERAAWSFAYLVTAPRFLGNSFNPVSFWYIYDENRKLIMMILEVNNTFDERRMYLLKGKAEVSQSSGDLTMFTDTWAKDFHVSPFNSRKGTYSLKVIDPFARQGEGSQQVDNVITLMSTQDHVKLVARVFSTTEAVSPTGLSRLSIAIFLFRYGWIGFLTSPRIVYEASRLFFQRNLHVWFRPEIVNTSIGRAATAEEMVIEEAFRTYLQDLVCCSPHPVRLKYTPPSRMASPEMMQSTNTDAYGAIKEDIAVKITTPAFFSRFVHYAHTLEALDREGLTASPPNRTVEIDNMSLLTRMIKNQPRLASEAASEFEKGSASSPSTAERWRWRLLQASRCPVTEQAYPFNHILRPPGSSAPVSSDMATRKPEFAITDIRTFGLSALDRYMRNKGAMAGSYRRAVTRLFVAERLALGQVWLVKVVDLIARAALIWIACVGVEGSGGAYVGHGGAFRLQGLAVSAIVGGLPHAWSLAKG